MMIEGMMIYGSFSYDEKGELNTDIHKQQRLKWLSKVWLNDTEISALIRFEDMSEMIIPVTSSRLDHSDTQLFNFFIPSLKDVSAIMIQDQDHSRLFDLEK